MAHHYRDIIARTYCVELANAEDVTIRDTTTVLGQIPDGVSFPTPGQEDKVTWRVKNFSIVDRITVNLIDMEFWSGFEWEPISDTDERWPFLEDLGDLHEHVGMNKIRKFRDNQDSPETTGPLQKLESPQAGLPRKSCAELVLLSLTAGECELEVG